jgi:hypothetical protein
MATAAMLSVFVGAVLVGEKAATQEKGAELSPVSGNFSKPRRHFRLRNPAELPPAQAELIYQIAAPSLEKGYTMSNHPVAEAYHTWPRFNTAPYLSVTHGNKYINNFANEIAGTYGKFEDASEMPVGSVIAKDSFSVTESHEILLGPLFLMEKMPAGFNEVSGNWKYTQIQPDGTVLGETNGEGSDAVRYCIGCHAAVEQQDHLFFVPRAYRTER